MQREFLTFVCLAVLLGSGVACSFSKSSETIGDSISSPFDWSSDSSNSSGGGDSAYRQDVSDYTVAFVRSGGDIDSFRSGLRRIAERRGITDWEGDELTCASIGLGLQRANFDEAAAFEFGRALFGADTPGLDDLGVGYASIP